MSKQKNNELPLRSEIEESNTWRLEDIFASDQVWEQSFENVKALSEQIKVYQGTLSKSADTLEMALKAKDELLMLLGQLYTYAHMRFDQDTTHSFYQGMDMRCKSLYAQVESDIAYYTPELLQMDEKVLLEYLDSYEPLKVYKQHILEILQRRPHTLAVEQEQLLAQASEILDAPSHIFGMLNNADLVFPKIKNDVGDEVVLTHGRFIPFLLSENQQVRKDAFNALYGVYDQFKNTFAATLNGAIKKHVFEAKVRNFNSARHAALFANHIPETVYDQLVTSIHKNLHLLQRYLKLRKKALGLNELHMYDLYTPLIQDIKMPINFEEAKSILFEALKPMGEEYLTILKEGLHERWVDVYENKGKRSGAYSSGAYGTKPYVLMNWEENINSLFTLAHEFGHSLHSHYTRNHQPFVYGDYSIFVAEVASTCNEALLNDYLIKHTADKQKRLYLINHYLEGFRGTVFRQTMFAEFEYLIHKKVEDGEALTAECLTKVYYDLNKLYFGEEHLVIDEAIGLEWARIPHFYYNFYVYQYATGFSAATALSQQILEEGPSGAQRYLAFLKAGCSDTPIEVLKKAGVDMTSAEAVDAACRVFEARLQEMEELMV